MCSEYKKKSPLHKILPLLVCFCFLPFERGLLLICQRNVIKSRPPFSRAFLFANLNPYVSGTFYELHNLMNRDCVFTCRGSQVVCACTGVCVWY